MENLNKKIKELSEAILETEEFKTYQKTKEELENDEKSSKLFNDFQEAQQKLAIFQQGDFPEKEEQKKKTEELLSQVRKDKKINNWIQAQKALGTLTGEIATALSNEVNFPVTLPTKKCGGGCC